MLQRLAWLLPEAARRAAPPERVTTTYREIFEAIALPVLMLDRETWLVVAVNQAAVAQYGYPLDEFIGMNVLQVRPPEGRPEARRILSEMPHGFWKTTGVVHQRKDGTTFRADVWSRDTLVDGRPVRVCTIADVTDRVQLQQELQHVQKLETVGRLAGGIAHDFNNALTVILGGAELLDERVGHLPDASDEIAAIRVAAEAAASRTRQLLAFSRQQMLSVELLPLNDVVNRAAVLLRTIIGERVELRTLLDPGTGDVRVDAGQLVQVVVNLATNARDAMPAGGTLTLATRPLDLEADRAIGGLTIPAGEYAELTATDTGLGMEEATRVRVFEPFFTTKPRPEATGLGLSTAYGIVRQTGGFITVDSVLGAGSTFRVLLPRARPFTPPPSGPPLEAERTERQIALLVEDEDAVRRTTRRVLERLGYEVIEAATGDEALELVGTDRHLSLLVTDEVLPGMRGSDVGGRLRAAYPELRVLIVSGYTDETATGIGIIEERVGFLPRPFTPESLDEAIRTLLHGG